MGERSLPEIFEELKDRRRHGDSPDKMRARMVALIGELASDADRQGSQMLAYILQMAKLEAAALSEIRDVGRVREDKPSDWARHLEIHALAHRVFGNPQKAEAWLSRPNPSFDGQVPSELLRDDLGAAVVRDTLEQIDHGIFA